MKEKKWSKEPEPTSRWRVKTQCSAFLKLQHLHSQGYINVQRNIQNHLRIWEKFVVTFYLSINFHALNFFPHGQRSKLQRIMLLILANLMFFSFFVYNTKVKMLIHKEWCVWDVCVYMCLFCQRTWGYWCYCLVTV